MRKGRIFTSLLLIQSLVLFSATSCWVAPALNSLMQQESDDNTGLLAAAAAWWSNNGGSGSSGSSSVGCQATLGAATDLRWPTDDVERIAYVGDLVNNQNCGLSASSPRGFLSFPRAIAVDDDNQLVYVTDSLGVTIFELATAEMRRFANDSTDGVADPMGIAISGDGTVYIADVGLKAIRVYTSDGTLIRTIGSGTLENPVSVALDDNLGRLYVADTHSNKVLIYNTADGSKNALEITDGISVPVAIAVNSKGNVHVVHWNIGDKVRVFDSSGNLLRSFAEQGNHAGQLMRPKGIAIDSFDNMYISDIAFNNFQIFDESGQLLLFVGQGGNGNVPGNIAAAGQVAIDGQNRIYVADQWMHGIHVFQLINGE